MPLGPLSQPGASARVPTVTASVSASAIAGTVAGTAGGATISFTASDNPGKPSGNYVATSSPSGFTSSASVSPISFSSGVLAVGTAYTFTVVKQSGSGISSNASTPSGSITAFTVPSAPVLGINVTDNNITWTWSSAGNGGNAITGWQYAISTNNGAYSGYTTVSAATLTHVVSNFRNLDQLKLKVRAVNAAGPGLDTESSNSTPWSFQNVETTFSENSAPQACSSVFCGTSNVNCFSQAQEQVKTRTVTRTTPTYTRGVTTSTDAYSDSAPDFAGIAYGACYNVGGCNSVGTSLVTGSNGQIVFVGGAAGTNFRIFDSFFGNWAVCNSVGTFTMQVGSCGSGCSSKPCYAFSTSIQYCSVDGSYIPVGYIQLGACGFFCSAAGAC